MSSQARVTFVSGTAQDDYNGLVREYEYSKIETEYTIDYWNNEYGRNERYLTRVHIFHFKRDGVVIGHSIQSYSDFYAKFNFSLFWECDLIALAKYEQSGYTAPHGYLSHWFAQIQNRSNWKGRIDRVLSQVSPYNERAILDSISFFAGGGGRIEHLFDKYGVAMMRVTAPGYYALIGA